VKCTKKIVLICVLGMVGGDRNSFVRKEGASQKRLRNTVLMKFHFVRYWQLKVLQLFSPVLLSVRYNHNCKDSSLVQKNYCFSVEYILYVHVLCFALYVTFHISALHNLL